MTTITDIKSRVQGLSPARFQEFCDTLIHKNGYGRVHGYGMQAGTGKTTIGNPDSYFRKDNGKYVFVAYTTQQNNIYIKLKEDIEKCLDKSKTGLSTTEIDEIICCHTSSNLSAGDDKKLHDFCEEKGISLIIWGIDEIANQIFTNYRSMITELGLSIDTNQILDVENFVNIYDSNKMLAPLSTNFQFRERELNSLLSELQSNGIIVVTGKAGVGKTRLVLEAVQIFARRENYKLLCVKNNNLSLYQDLVSATETPGKYMFFVDDANELADLNQILQYTTQIQKGYEVKIILTVRDYVKMKVIEAAKQYGLPRVIELSPFSDEELKLFLNKNLNIFNTDYIKQIIRIAEGNPRIAYMAGKLASKSQNFSMIQNAYDIYDQYYRKYVEESFGNDEELCITAGILSILNCVLLDDLSPLQDLLKAHGMTIELFKMKVRQLSSLEFVEIHLEQVATLSDQCLSNYMLYYIFFQKKLMCLSTVLEICYKNFRNSMINTLNTILNLYESDDTRDYCSNEIKKVWNKLKDDQHPDFIDFVEDFHVFNPEESFILAKKKINDINKQDGFNIVLKEDNYSEGFYFDSLVQYVGVGYNVGHYSGTHLVLRHILSLDYLWNNVRVRNGAYGSGAIFSTFGDFTLWSYRDPNLTETLDIYYNIAEYIANFDADNNELNKYIIGALNTLDVLMSPSAQASYSLAQYLTESPYEKYDVIVSEIKNTTVTNLKKLCSEFENRRFSSFKCVLGAKEKVLENKELFTQTIELK